MDATEQFAMRVVERGSNARLVFHSDQSRPICDFRLIRPGLASGVLEVTLATEESAESLQAELRKNGSFLPRSLCKHDWWIHPETRASIRRVRSEADRLLHAIEQEGITEFYSELHAGQSGAVRAIWKELAIEAGQVVEWKDSPSIGVSGPSSGGITGAIEVAAAAEAEMNKPDNLRKLRESEAEERHLFVVIGPHKGAAWSSIRVCEPPDSPIGLPAEVSHLWVAAAAGSLAYVWLCTQDGWRNLGPIELAD